MFAMAQALRSPGNGEIEFVCIGESENESKSLFAHRIILRTRSEYFDTSKSRKLFTELLVLGSSFTEGTPGPITTEEDFDVLHNILYYLYTDRITFADRNGACPSKNLPRICRAEDIYETANRMMLDNLKLKAFKFLELTCDNYNVTSRVISNFASLHPQVAQLYDNYFMANWKSIQGTDEFKRVFEEVEDDFDEFKRRHEKFMDLIMKATS
jgi:hypothetical protein